MRDGLLVFSDMEPRSTGATSSEVIDFGEGKSDYGKSYPYNFFNVRITEAFAGEGATLKVELQHSDDNSSFTTAVAGEALAVDKLTGGTLMVCQPLPFKFKRYVKVVATVGTAAMTAGKISAWIGERVEE
jgi:hypothetical protein